MTTLIFFKLIALFAIVALGWVAGKLRWLGENDPARTLSNAAAAIFVPVMALMVVVYAWQRRANRHGALATPAPAVRAITSSFGNTVQVGIPIATALFGEAGLSIHIAVMSLHALALLSVLTVLVELDLARERHEVGHARASLAATLGTTARNTLIHPVVLPIVAGLVWNVVAPPLPTLIDELLLTLAQAVVPMCLVLIGMSLAYYGVRGAARGALLLAGVKLLGLPALVLVVAHWGFGLTGLPLAVVVMMGALPAGSNALMFAQRYQTLEAETTAAIVFSTLGFVLTAPIWLALLARFFS